MSNGWSEERRARQASAIRAWKPWTKSTGPRTKAGKARCAHNAMKHGARSRPAIAEQRYIGELLRRTGAVNHELFACAMRLQRENDAGDTQKKFPTN